MKEKLSLLSSVNFKSVFRGILVVCILVFLLSALLSLVLFFTSLSELWMQPLGVVITMLALFFGGRSAAREAGTKGLNHGLLVGLLFVVIMIILSSFQDISWSIVPVKSAYALLAAMLGGISGVK